MPATYSRTLILAAKDTAPLWKSNTKQSQILAASDCRRGFGGAGGQADGRSSRSPPFRTWQTCARRRLVYTLSAICLRLRLHWKKYSKNRYHYFGIYCRCRSCIYLNKFIIFSINLTLQEIQFTIWCKLIGDTYLNKSNNYTHKFNKNFFIFLSVLMERGAGLLPTSLLAQRHCFCLPFCISIYSQV